MPRGKNVRPISVAVTPSAGQWVSFVTVGRKPNGDSDRRKRSAAMCDSCKATPKVGCECYQRCVEKVRELEDQIAARAVERPGRRPTVKTWFTTWLAEIAPVQPSARSREPLRRLTLDGYWSKCEHWIFPHLGGLELDELDTTDLDRLYAAMYAGGLKASSVRNMHSTIKRGLSIAVQRKKVDRNVAADMDPPGAQAGRRKKALSRAQVDAVLSAIEQRDDRLRWKVGLAVGPRQGEVLGLRWSHVDLDEGTVDTSWQIQRHGWKHGCDDPAGCGKHVTPQVCPGGATHERYHRSGCPKVRGKVCPPRCTGHAFRCPQRKEGGIKFVRPKTYRDDGDQHIVALPEPLVRELRDHRKTQAAARLKAGSVWVDHDLVFCQADGKPLEPRKDYGRWQSILKSAGLAGGGTHVMRATAATLLLSLGEDIAVVQEVLGHRDIRITRGYTEVGVGLTRRAADRMSQVFGTATDLATARQRRKRTS